MKLPRFPPAAHRSLLACQKLLDSMEKGASAAVSHEPHDANNETSQSRRIANSIADFWSSPACGATLFIVNFILSVCYFTREFSYNW
jgi:hypothetical protein